MSEDAVSTTYEDNLVLIASAQRGVSDRERTIQWCAEGCPIGVARSPEGRIEIFIECVQLEPRYREIRENLVFQNWKRLNGDDLQANRFMLPAAGHFDQVAAFVCTELLRLGGASDPVAAFTKAEPVIALALERLRISDQSILGLAGELTLLEGLMMKCEDAKVPAVLETWKGFGETARDFQLGHVGVEVKTTTSAASSHLFHGVHQLEVGHGVDGVEEDTLFLCSVGLDWASGDVPHNSRSIPELVDSILGRLDEVLGDAAAEPASRFLARVEAYGEDADYGYRHHSMKSDPAFARPFTISFLRLYDVMDPNLQLLRTPDLQLRPVIDAESLRYRVNFPAKVTGDLNPVVGLGSAVAEILERST